LSSIDDKTTWLERAQAKLSGNQHSQDVHTVERNQEVPTEHDDDSISSLRRFRQSLVAKEATFDWGPVHPNRRSEGRGNHFPVERIEAGFERPRSASEIAERLFHGSEVHGQHKVEEDPDLRLVLKSSSQSPTPRRRSHDERMRPPYRASREPTSVAGIVPPSVVRTPNDPPPKYNRSSDISVVGSSGSLPPRNPEIAPLRVRREDLIDRGERGDSSPSGWSSSRRSGATSMTKSPSSLKTQGSRADTEKAHNLRTLSRSRRRVGTSSVQFQSRNPAPCHRAESLLAEAKHNLAFSMRSPSPVSSVASSAARSEEEGEQEQEWRRRRQMMFCGAAGTT